MGDGGSDERAQKDVGRVVDADIDAGQREEGGEQEHRGADGRDEQPDGDGKGKSAGGVVAREGGCGGVGQQRLKALLDERALAEVQAAEELVEGSGGGGGQDGGEDREVGSLEGEQAEDEEEPERAAFGDVEDESVKGMVAADGAADLVEK